MLTVVLAVALMGVLFGDSRVRYAGLIAAASIDLPSTTGNLVKHLGLAAAFAWRAGCRPHNMHAVRPPSLLFGGFFVLATVLLLVTPYPQDGARFIGYLLSLALIIAGVARTFSALDAVTLQWMAAVGLALGSVQTFLLGNHWSSAGRGFTAFSQAQTFAFLLSLLTVLIWHRARGKTRWAWVVVLMGALVLNGSRSALVATLAAISLGLLLKRRQGRPAVVALTVMLSLVGVLVVQSIDLGDGHRLQVLAALAQGASPADVGGTVHARSILWNATWTEISRRPFADQLLGTGPASGGLVPQRTFVWRYSTTDDPDNNRVIHNDFLRLVYETGLVGALLLLSGAVTAFRRMWRASSSRDRCLVSSLTVLAVVAALTGNALASGVAGNGLVLGFAMAGAYAATSSGTALPDHRRSSRSESRLRDRPTRLSVDEPTGP